MKDFPNVVPDSTLLPRECWGAWAKRPGYLMLSTEREQPKTHHHFGGDPNLYPDCPCCGKKMRIFATFDLADAALSLTIGAPSDYQRLLLPYCPRCTSMLGINVYHMTDRGRQIRTVYQNHEAM